MKITIHQPNLFPRLKVIQKMCMVDEVVILNDVQYVRREWQNRCRLRHFSDPSNEFWLTAKITKCNRDILIKDVKLNDFNDTKRNIQNLIENSYSKSPYINDILRYLNLVISKPTKSLEELCFRSIYYLSKILEIDITFHNSSNFNIDNIQSSQRILEICKRMKADFYLSDSGGNNYLNKNIFGNIIVMTQRWESPKDSSSLEFRDYSFLDYFARYGKKALKKHLLYEHKYE